jgi:uncharacterized delta-60 repeat protein
MEKKLLKLKSSTLLLLPILLIISIALFSGTQTQNSLQLQSNPLSISSEAPSASWYTTWGGADQDLARGIAVDLSGNIYCVGQTDSSGAGNTDLALVKFLPDKTKAWNRTWGGLDNEYGYDVAIDANGNIYCVGSTSTFTASPFDLALVKFYPNGTKAWNKTWDNSASENGYGVAVDASGNIYCTGSTTANNGDLIAVKFFPNGTKAWDATWGGSAGDFAQEVAIDSNGAAYCVGSTSSYGSGGVDLALVKYFPNGTKAWNTTWGAHATDNGKAIAINPDNEIFCIGYTASFADPSGDMALVKFFTNGTRHWNVTWGSPNTENAQDIVINPCHSIYITYDVEAAGIPLVLERFMPNGTMMWNTSWNGIGTEKGRNLAVYGDGGVYCLADYNTGQDDFLLVKFLDPLDCKLSGGIPGFESIAIVISLFVFVIIYTTRRYRKQPQIP